ncbi:MAG: ectonucleotide pyrophosphatase/phosphodiesterase [Verrucomicrobia bacterium]|nr:ectonucleotide pyrophosphatase/phosphodiesterase [Verrucomicrobiota bacterium]
MKFRTLAFSVLSLLALTDSLAQPPAPAASANPRALLLISIDGMRPDYVLQAEKLGFTVPHLAGLARDGASATGVRGVLPTATYPSHTSIITGAAPARHGIVANHPFAGAVKDLDVWYYYAEDLRAPTLWDAAASAGYVTGSVSWPVTVGHTAIRWNIPEYALTRTPEDVKMTRGASTPGLMAQLEKNAGPYLTEVADATKRDWARTRYTIELIRQKHARFVTVHLAATDNQQHRHGPLTPQVKTALAEIDRMVGELRDAIRAEDPRAAVCVVSDHGFAPVTQVLWLDAIFVKEGLITLKTKETTVEKSGVTDWVARPWHAGGSAAIVLKNPDDPDARAKVKALLDRLAADPANGIAAILDEAAIREAGGAPTASFWVTMRSGFMVSPTLQPSIVSVVSARGTHGYAPSLPDVAATFIVAGEGIAPGRDLGSIDMRAIAPTLARLMGAPFPSAEAPAIDLSYAKK